MLVVFKDQVLALQIGDSALVARKAGVWEAICWPENGEFASTTYFVTDDPEVRLHTYRFDREHDAFALFSDGLESVALEQATQQPFARFFDPISNRWIKHGRMGALPSYQMHSRVICRALRCASARMMTRRSFCCRVDEIYAGQDRR